MKNAFKLLKAELAKMPTLQYPNINKLFQLFTDASKHSYSGILHQEEISKEPNAEANLIPIVYFSGSFGRTQQLWNTMQKSVMWSTGQSKNLLFILQAQKVCYPVTTNH